MCSYVCGFPNFIRNFPNFLSPHYITFRHTNMNGGRIVRKERTFILEEEGVSYQILI